MQWSARKRGEVLRPMWHQGPADLPRTIQHFRCGLKPSFMLQRCSLVCLWLLSLIAPPILPVSWSCFPSAGAKASQFADFKDIYDFQKDNDLEQNFENQSVLRYTYLFFTVMKIFVLLWPNNSEPVLCSLTVSPAHRPCQLQCITLNSVRAALHPLPPTSSLSSVLNKSVLGVAVCPSPVHWCTYTIKAVKKLSPCRSCMHLIYIYWLLWYNLFITWKADPLLLRTTRASSSFPVLSGRTLPHNTYTSDLW